MSFIMLDKISSTTDEGGKVRYFFDGTIVINTKLITTIEVENFRFSDLLQMEHEVDPERAARLKVYHNNYCQSDHRIARVNYLVCNEEKSVLVAKPIDNIFLSISRI